MKAHQYFQSAIFLVLILLAAGVGDFDIISLPVVDGSRGGLIGSSAQAAGEPPRDVLAAQIRMRGVACDKPLSAVRDAKRSKPDHAVWVLKCGNATYRISRAPDHGGENRATSIAPSVALYMAINLPRDGSGNMYTLEKGGRSKDELS
jgi:hypothetical protein